MYLIQLSNLFSTWNSMLGTGEKKKSREQEKELRNVVLSKHALRCFWCEMMKSLFSALCKKEKKYHTRWSSHNAMLDEVTQTKLKLADRWNRSEERMLPTPSTSSLKCRKDQVNCAWSKKVPKKIISLSFYKIKLLWHKPKQKKGNQTRFALELPIRALNKFLLWRTHQGKGEKHIKERRRRRWLNSICSANKKGEMKSLPEKWTR